jgi:hypothetical protein
MPGRKFFRFFSQRGHTQEDIDNRVAAATGVVAAHGMNTAMSVDRAVISIEGFEPPFTTADFKSSIIYHDLGHVVANGFRGPVVDESENGDKVEYMANLAKDVLQAKFAQAHNAAQKLQRRLIGEVEIGIQKQQKYHGPSPRRPLPFTKMPPNKPQLTWDNYPDYKTALGRAMMARDFFTSMTGLEPYEIGIARLYHVPLGLFGVHAVAREDGMTEIFNFYPEDQRTAAIASITNE